MTLFGGDRTVAVRLLLDPRGYGAGLAVAKKQTSDFAKAGIESAGKHKRSFEEIGQGALLAGGVIGGLAVTAVASFAKFDKAMSRAKAGTQATASQMTALRSAALKAGADTQYSATEAADAITAMGKAGVSTNDILSGGLKGSLDLAAAGELEVGRAAEVAATTMTQFALKGTDMGHIADVLAAGAGKAQGSVEDLSQGLKYVGPVAHAAGISLEQTVGVLAEFSSQGIIGEQAGTAFRGILLSLQNPSVKAAGVMKDLGIELYDAKGHFIGADGAAQALQDSMSGLSEAERDAALGTLFGNEQITAARILYSGGAKAVQEWQQKVNDAGFASRQAGELMNNLSGDLEQLKGSLETTFISTGAGANEGLRALTKGATGAVNAFGLLPDPLQKDVVLVAGLTAGALILGGGMLILATKIKSAKVAMGELGISTEKTRKGAVLAGKAIGAIGLLSVIPDLKDQLDGALGSLPTDLTALSLSLGKLQQSGKVTGELSKAFGSDFEGASSWARSWTGETESLSGAVDRLSKKHWLPDGLYRAGDSSAKSFEHLGEALAALVSSGDQEQAAAQFNAIAEKAGLTGDQTGKLLDLMPAYKDALGQVQLASKDTSVSIESMARGEKSAAQAAKDATAAMDDLLKSITAYTDGVIGSEESADSFEAAIDAGTAALKDNGRTLDNTTEKGRANRAALRDLAKTGLAYAQQTYENTGSTDKFAAIVERTRNELIKQGVRFGKTKAEAKQYANQLLGTPRAVETAVRLQGAQAAIDKLNTLIAQAKAAGRLTVSVGVTTIPQSLLKRAEGGITHAYADGGREDHQAQIAPAGAMRLWAEPETGGEAYIPLAPGKRARSKKILKETAHLIGMTAYADGGLAGLKNATPYSLGDSLARYKDSRLDPITQKQYEAAQKARAAARDRTKNATQAVDKAERDLHDRRKHHPKDINAIRDAEERLDRARRAEAAARKNEAEKVKAAKSAVARKNAPKGFDLGDYAKSLAGTVKTTERFRAELQVIAKRGGQPLADLLEGMGDEGGPLIHALVKANTKNFTKVVNLLKRLDPAAFAGDGLTYKKFAAGGVETRVAQYGGSTTRVWNEPETGGEAYIPLAASRRARSRMLATDVVARLGGTATWSTARAAGPVNSISAAPTAGGPPGPLFTVGQVQLVRGGPEDVADQLAFRIRSAGR